MDDLGKQNEAAAAAATINNSGSTMNDQQNNDADERNNNINSGSRGGDAYHDVVGSSNEQQAAYEMLQSQTGQSGASMVIAPPDYQQEPDEIVQVVYQSNQNGSLVGVESSLLRSYEQQNNPYRGQLVGGNTLLEQEAAVHNALQQSRATSTLPSVAEEGSSSGAGGLGANNEHEYGIESSGQLIALDDATSRSLSRGNDMFADSTVTGLEQQQNYNTVYQPDYNQQQQFDFEQQNAVGPLNPEAIYSTINKQQARNNRAFEYGGTTAADGQVLYSNLPVEEPGQNYATNVYDQSPNLAQDQKETPAADGDEGDFVSPLPAKHSIINELDEENHLNLVDQLGEETKDYNEQEQQVKENNDGENDANEITHLFVRQKQGAAESGSFRNNFRRKKLGVSVSTNENELTAHRQKLLESQEANSVEANEEGELGSLPKFKRTHSVSFNVTRGSRHSVDIRNLPSYLTVKRASIVDVAKGAMSSLMHSFGGSSQSSQRRDSSPDEEPIFEEPIAPTLSLGQRVALVKNSGAEFGTVGWIGQLPDVDDDWIVGVIFDNMIGDCDGAYNGVRYFYARENYAMFVPLSSLTKTDNYIGRPETGTMLSRMSVSLKPGQLISIQRSSIRLQHCFLNAPHQRVGHDVRAVSNRLHCQCHNCGPCAHLTKQGRVSAIPPFGTHHVPNKKNSLAHAAVEILAHHHHHYHEDEHKHEDEYQFGDNAAHACNFVRYSCCQQNGVAGHSFSADCQMVRPELLDNLIHAPRAPHRRSRPRRRRMRNQAAIRQQVPNGVDAITAPHLMDTANNNFNSTLSTIDGGNGTIKSWGESENRPNGSESSYSTRSSSFSSTGDEGGDAGYRYDNQGHGQQATGEINYEYNVSNQYQPNLYSTIDSRMSVIEQQKILYQRESASYVRQSPQSHLEDDYDGHNRSSLGSSIRRCLACIMCRKKRNRRPKKRKVSARARLIEYRRKQSTFVPSTLAKPQDDFASHGIIIPSLNQPLPECNSDYSSYSKSSCSSPSKSPVHQVDGVDQKADMPQNQLSFTLEHGVPTYNEQLKSSQTYHGQGLKQLNYGDYTFSDESYNKNSYNNSTLTDLGYCDSWANSSNDTLKQMIDQSINEEVARPEPISMQQVDISPISSNEGNNYNDDHIDISSPTTSSVEQELDDMSQQVDRLGLEGDPDTHID